jgi:hypothetical protein
VHTPHVVAGERVLMRATRAEAGRYAVLALLTTAIVSLALLLTVHRGNDKVVSMLAPAAGGRSAPLFRADFPSYRLPAGLGHDGQFFYAIARQPMHPKSIAPVVDRPRYRLQRILFRCSPGPLSPKVEAKAWRSPCTSSPR